MTSFQANRSLILDFSQFVGKITLHKMKQVIVIIINLFFTLKSNALGETKEGVCNQDGLCINFLLEVTASVSTIGECYLKCVENQECQWYTFNSKFGTCHLNMGCNSVVLENQEFVHNHKECEVLKSKYCTCSILTFLFSQCS